MALISLIAMSAIFGAAGQNPVAAPLATEATPAKPEKICQRIVPTGSIMAKKFCMTAPEWKEFKSRTNAGAERFLDRRQSGMCDYKCSETATFR